MLYLDGTYLMTVLPRSLPVFLRDSFNAAGSSVLCIRVWRENCCRVVNAFVEYAGREGARWL